MSLFFISDIGFEVPDAFLVGYALDYNEYFRDLSVSLQTVISPDENLAFYETIAMTQFHTTTNCIEHVYIDSHDFTSKISMDFMNE